MDLIPSTLFVHIDSFSRDTRVSATPGDDADGWMRTTGSSVRGSGPCVKNGNTENESQTRRVVLSHRGSGSGRKRSSASEGVGRRAQKATHRRRESSGVVGSRKLDGRESAMSLAFDEFGRPFIIIKVRGVDATEVVCRVAVDGWMDDFSDVCARMMGE